MTAGEPKVTLDLALSHGLTAEEYDRIIRRLHREPTFTELGLFSALWSEHCAYKHSRVFLRGLPTQAPHVLQGPGENAGIVDLGGDLALAFKIESHNHPSFIEPFQGAATGVGGILRDIFTMGARPVAVMDSLRFGPIARSSVEGRGASPVQHTAAEIHKNHSVMEGVVSGVASYGNCFGVPNLGGEVKFESCYSGNPLVNAFALGLVRKDQIFYARAAGEGNPVIYVGAKTGRDGIHGATMASAEFNAEAEEKRPTVQVGDPFTEKLLLEACLELFQTDAVVGIQDMGAAGLTSSSGEMAGRGGNGLDLFLDQVPLREEGMTPYEILLSESQERMLLVAAEGKEDVVLRICRKWDLDVAVIGRVTSTGRWRAHWHGKLVADLPVDPLTEGAPKYERPMKPHPALPELNAFDATKLPAPKDLGQALRARPVRHLGEVLQVLACQIKGGLREQDVDERLRDLPMQAFAFLDTETSGLMGGTGTYAFLIGIGYRTAAGFELIQFFMRDPGQEPTFILREGSTYCLRPGLDLWLDAEVFSSEIARAESLLSTDRTGAVALLLLVACSNVTNLMLAAVSGIVRGHKGAIMVRSLAVCAGHRGSRRLSYPSARR